jgi:hypothetical protein
MTHDELLKKINRYSLRTSMLDTLGWNALRAAVKLHKPLSDPAMTCSECSAVLYPCPTIYAIEKELE